MFDAFRGHETWLAQNPKAANDWNQDISTFWTFGSPGSSGTLLLTALGMLVMVIAIIGWVVLEHRKLTAQAERLKAAGLAR
jgi:hypothetical protein